MTTVQPAVRTRAGFFSLLLSLIFVLPLHIGAIATMLRSRRGDDISYRASNFIFDFGAIVFVLCLILGIVGFIQGGESRRLGLTGVAILVFGTIASIGWFFIR